MYLLILGLTSIGYGIYAFLHSSQIAEKNRIHIESGQERYFEERRSWATYNSTPPADETSVRRRGVREIWIGVAALILSAIFYCLGHF